MRRQAHASTRPDELGVVSSDVAVDTPRGLSSGSSSSRDADPHGRRSAVVLRAVAAVEPHAPAARLLMSSAGQTSGRGRGAVPRGREERGMSTGEKEAGERRKEQGGGGG
jgi:hypothetical protein